MQWLNEPPVWNADGSTLTVTAGPKSDFWRKTHYGFIHDNGHFYFMPVSGGFVAEVKVSGQYRSLYDHCGLMVRQDETVWMKCGIEYVEGVQYISAVVTRDFSDWSVLPLVESIAAIWLRVRREGGTLEIFYSLDGETFVMYRTARLSEAETLDVGIMIASPEGESFDATFEGFTLTPIS